MTDIYGLKLRLAPLKGILPLEDSYWHLLDPPFHDLLQKVKDEDSSEMLLYFDRP